MLIYADLYAKSLHIPTRDSHKLAGGGIFTGVTMLMRS